MDDYTDEERALYEKLQARITYRRKTLGSLEERLGLPIGFIIELGTEQNDWAYIVKLAVSVEAAVTHALIVQLGDERLYEHFSSIGNSRRLEIACTLGLLGRAEKGVLEVLATVRNSFAHDVKNLSGTLSSYIGHLTQERKREIVLKLVNFSDGNIEKPKVTDNFDWLAPWFRTLLHTAVVNPLIALAAQGAEAKRKAEQRQWLEARAKENGYPPALALMLSEVPVTDEEVRLLLSRFVDVNDGGDVKP